jgi:nucleoside-diphosphate kinase
LERTLVILKPDAVQRGLVGPILSRLEVRGLKLVGLKFLSVPSDLAQQHYAVHREKPFFADLVSFITSGPVVVGVLEGPAAISVVRSMMGGTNPAASAPGTIRGDWALDITHNLIHGSDAPETAQAEIALWFRPEELVTWSRDGQGWIADPD